MNTAGGDVMPDRKRNLLLSMIDSAGLLRAEAGELALRRSYAAGRTDGGAGTWYYPGSFFRAGGMLFFVAAVDGLKSLFVLSDTAIPASFPGTTFSVGGYKGVEAAFGWDSFLAAREYLPFLTPVSLRDRKTTIGCGDRLGTASPGHIRAVSGRNISPVLAQQSIRELTLTGRTYRQVVSDAAFAVLQEGYEGGYGADGDHLKTLADIDVALDAGMPMITLDLTDVMNPEPGSWSEAAVTEAFKKLPAAVQDRVLSEYAGKAFNIGSSSLTLSRTEACRCALMYMKALDFSAEVDAHLRAKRGNAYDLEISIDETTTPTIPEHHLFIAAELKRRGVAVNSVAPRFVGEFQKGIDYIGDTAEFERQFMVHCDIAKTYGGYKISIHSGSDKFSVYPAIGRHTDLRVHVKTAGTNWLAALHAVSMYDPALFRSVLDASYRHYPAALKLYHITPDLSRIPSQSGIADDALPLFLERPESRQLLHVVYGGILTDPELAPRLKRFLEDHEEAYYASVMTHIVKHLDTLGIPRA